VEALLRHELGTGRTVFCTYPIEHMAARTPRVNPEPTWRIYSALADVAGVSRPIRVDDPRVLVGRLRSPDRETVLFVNCSPDHVRAEPNVAGGAGPAACLEPLSIEPFGVAVIRCRRSEPPAHGRAHAVAAGEGRDARR
jgi:hypothetical protein